MTSVAADGLRTSVLMPAYRSEGTIRQAAESVLAQTAGDLELIVVDDCSPVPARDALAGIRDPRLRILRRQRNGGPGRARNSGLAAARAPLISQLDADDMWEPGYLERVLPRFGDERVGLVYTNARILDHPTGHDDYIGDGSIHPRDGFPELLDANPIPAPTVTARAAAVRAVGGWSRWLRFVADYNLYLKLAAAGWRFDYVDEQLARYRWPGPGGGLGYDHRRSARWRLGMAVAFACSHPGTEGVWRALARQVPAALSGPRRPP